MDITESLFIKVVLIVLCTGYILASKKIGKLYGLKNIMMALVFYTKSKTHGIVALYGLEIAFQSALLWQKKHKNRINSACSFAYSIILLGSIFENR